MHFLLGVFLLERNRVDWCSSRLFDCLTRYVVLSAAWWYEYVGNLSVGLAHYPTIFVWRFVSREISVRVDSFFSGFICFLLAQWLAWFIAGDYLHAKWTAELLEANRRYYEEKKLKL